MMAAGAEAESTMGSPSKHNPVTEANSTLASTLRCGAARARANRAPPLTSSIGTRREAWADLRGAA